MGKQEAAITHPYLKSCKNIGIYVPTNESLSIVCTAYAFTKRGLTRHDMEQKLEIELVSHFPS